MPGSVQPAGLSPALPSPILCCPPVDAQPSAQPGPKPSAILAGSQGAHVLDPKKAADEREKPSLEHPSTLGSFLSPLVSALPPLYRALSPIRRYFCFLC